MSQSGTPFPVPAEECLLLGARKGKKGKKEDDEKSQ
jgi:hypothetical protein